MYRYTFGQWEIGYSTQCSFIREWTIDSIQNYRTYIGTKFMTAIICGRVVWMGCCGDGHCGMFYFDNLI